MADTTITKLKQNMDAVDDLVNSNVATVTTPDGRVDKTFSEIQRQANEILANLGLEYPPIAYTAGLTVERNTQTYRYNDVIYINSRSDLPFTTTGAFDEGGWQVVQQINQSTVIFSADGIKGLDDAPKIDRAAYSVAGFYAGAEVGGGQFIYDASRDKADHNGGTIITPEAISAWDGTQGNLSVLLDWTGTGTGAFVRVHSIPLAKPELDISWFGAISDPSFDCLPSIYSAWAVNTDITWNSGGIVYISETLKYPTNNKTFRGLKGVSPFSNTSAISPVSGSSASSFLDGIVNLNESAGNVSTAGQYNKLIDFRIIGGMSDYTDPLDPFVSVIGANLENTKDWCGLINVTFRNCGVCWKVTGFLHDLQNIHFYQNYQIGECDSTMSSNLTNIWVQTAAKNWGTWTDVSIHNATIQQGNENQTLDDDVGMLCDRVNFSGYLYTEGGNSHIKVVDGSIVNVDYWLMGFCQLTAGGYGSYNIDAGSGGEIYVKGGRSSGTKSFLVGGNANAAKTIWLDIRETDTRFINSTESAELPVCENIKINRTYGKIERVNFRNRITSDKIALGTGSAVMWDQFNAPFSDPFGGEIEIQVSGSSTLDRYKVEFSDSTGLSPDVTINTIARYTGGDGSNNINLTYASGELTAQGKKSDQEIIMTVNSFGSMYPKPVTVTP